MNDMTSVITPKSDQLNADDLIAGPRTIRITEVKIRATPEQPVSIFFDGDNGKPYKPCKSMSRVLVAAWGPDAKAYVGRGLTLYRDPKVKWGGLEVGGIRISHMTNIDRDMVMALTETKGKRAPFMVKPLQAARGSTAEQSSSNRVTAGLEALIARINAAADPALVDAIFGDPAVVKQMAWLAENRPEMHQQVNDAAELRKLALSHQPEGRDDSEMGEAFNDAEAGPFGEPA